MSGDTAVLVGPHPGLIDWLKSHGVHFEVHEHPTTYTARETANTEQVNPATFAKTVGVVADDGRRALMVLDANDYLDLVKARHVMGASHVRLMTEDELALACPGCDVGAVPPVGELFGMPMHVDNAIRDIAVITFHAGSHRFAVHADRPEWERGAHVAYASLAAVTAREPAWIRS